MGFWRSLFSGEADPVALAAAEGPAFETASAVVDAHAIDPAVFGLTSYAAPTAPAPRVTRRAAEQVGAIARARDLVPATLGTLPIGWFEVGGAPSSRSVTLLEQPEANVPRSVTFTRLFEDLFYEGIAWWRITAFDWTGYPSQVIRLDPRSVDPGQRRDDRIYVGRNGQVQGTAEEWIPEAELIRFDSPRPGVLIAGARAIRTHLLLDAATNNYVDGAPPVEYFTPAEGADPIDDAEVAELLTAWQDARRKRGAGYVPAALQYHTGSWNPEQLQLGDARTKAVLELSRHTGIDPEDLGVSTTSRTYANQFDRRKERIDGTLRQFFVAVQDRLSMNDVCPRNVRARVDLAALLQSDPKSRYEAYELGLRVGAITPEQIATAEGNPTVNQPQTPPAAPTPATGGTTDPQGEPVPPRQSNVITARFDTEAELQLDAPAGATFEVNTERRVVSGLVVPYGVTARSMGQEWQFGEGTITYGAVSRVKLWISHDSSRAIGVATALESRPAGDHGPAGLYGTFKVARGQAGDDALALAEDGVLDGFSIGIKQGGKYRRDTKTGVLHAIEAPAMEVSLTPSPSYDDARVHAVAASAAAHQGGSTMPCSKCGQVHAAGVTACDAAALAQFQASQANPPADPPAAPAFDQEALNTAVATAVAAGFESLGDPQGGRQTVSAGTSGPAEVFEELPYRFDGGESPHSFGADLRAGFSGGDSEARQRVEEFMETAFAVTPANVTSLNPTQYRPELYVPNLEFSRPLWGLVSTGVVNDITPFSVPKFKSAAGLVGRHQTGVEPTPGSFEATLQTITPRPISGKVEILREVWDQGGNPKADAIIWREIVNGYYEGLEAEIAAALKSVTTGDNPQAEIALAGATDVALVDAMVAYYAGLQFVRGGNRFTATAADGRLYPSLINAKDDAGRKLLPVLGAANAQGTTDASFGEVQVGNQRIRPAWALGAGNDALSYNFVPSSVWAWASAPKRFTFEYQVKSIDMAVWGYSATAILRDSDVKPIDYTTADA